MKNISLGVDIEEINSFRKMVYGANKNFYGKVFTSREIKYCLSKKDPYPNFAARFAGKEAVIKATSGKIFGMKRIEIINGKDGSPKVKINLKGRILISLSHTDNNALAVVIWLN